MPALIRRSRDGRRDIGTSRLGTSVPTARVSFGLVAKARPAGLGLLENANCPTRTWPPKNPRKNLFGAPCLFPSSTCLCFSFSGWEISTCAFSLAWPSDLLCVPPLVFSCALPWGSCLLSHLPSAPVSPGQAGENHHLQQPQPERPQSPNPLGVYGVARLATLPLPLTFFFHIV